MTRADPVDVQVDALMRPVDSDLEACSTVGGRMGEVAGPHVLDRLKALGGLPVGGAVVTPGGELRAQFLIHIVIRSTEEPVSAERVRRAFQNGLRQAREWGIGTLAAPPIGMGAGNLDAETSAQAMLSVIVAHRLAYSVPEEILILVSSDYEEEVFLREAERGLAGSH